MLMKYMCNRIFIRVMFIKKTWVLRQLDLYTIFQNKHWVHSMYKQNTDTSSLTIWGSNSKLNIQHILSQYMYIHYIQHSWNLLSINVFRSSDCITANTLKYRKQHICTLYKCSSKTKDSVKRLISTHLISKFKMSWQF